MCLYSKCSVFWGGGIFLGPQGGKICAATSDLVFGLGIPEKAGVM